MNTPRGIGLGLVGWVVAITSLHLALNVDLSTWRNRRLPLAQRKLEVGYIPVT